MLKTAVALAAACVRVCPVRAQAGSDPVPAAAKLSGPIHTATRIDRSRTALRGEAPGGLSVTRRPLGPVPQAQL